MFFSAHRVEAVVACVCFAMITGCRGEPATQRDRAASPPAVTATRVESMSLQDERERVGQVRAVDDVELRARVAGFLERRAFIEGGMVEAGALLFVIERGPYQAEVERAEAEAARSAATLKKAELDLRRARDLRERGVVSAAAFDEAVTAEAEAAAAVLAAEARLRQARLDLEYTEIEAPFAGRIGRSRYSVGDLVGPESGALADLVTVDPMHVYWQVPEAVLLEARRTGLLSFEEGEPSIEVTAQLRFPDGSLYEHQGVWDFLDNRIDPDTGTQTARAVFPNPDGILVPGQHASVLVEVGQPRQALVVPQSAVQQDQAGRFVFVVDEEENAVRRDVTMGDRRGLFWEVRAGLAQGERVIYQGIQKVRPGAAVDVTVEAPKGPQLGPRR